MITHSTSLNNNLDLFFGIGSMRSMEEEDIWKVYLSAFIEDIDKALKILFWTRDIREGAGERRTFRIILKKLALNYPDKIAHLIQYIPLFGRFDDLLILLETPLSKNALSLIEKSLREKDQLCAKWMPRKGKKASIIAKFLNLSPKEYRKLIVNLTDVVETKICNKNFDEINYSNLPSIAASKYQKIFFKYDNERYKKYLQNLSTNDEKINSKAIFPYDIIKNINKDTIEISLKQWENLPNYMENSRKNALLPVIDTSGSMTARAGRAKNAITCLEVAVSLGLYISERNEGIFKDCFINFSDKPTINYLKGNLYERLNQLISTDWGFNTNLKAVFELILKQAIKHNIKEEEMPKKILIISDMEFDSALNATTIIDWGYENIERWDHTAQQTINKLYNDSGYNMPEVIYWNLSFRRGNVPVNKDENNTALISGFSPSIMKNILNSDKISPINTMNETIMTERYIMIKSKIK